MRKPSRHNSNKSGWINLFTSFLDFRDTPSMWIQMTNPLIMHYLGKCQPLGRINNEKLKGNDSNKQANVIQEYLSDQVLCSFGEIDWERVTGLCNFLVGLMRSLCFKRWLATEKLVTKHTNTPIVNFLAVIFGGNHLGGKIIHCPTESHSKTPLKLIKPLNPPGFSRMDRPTKVGDFEISVLV